MSKINLSKQLNALPFSERQAFLDKIQIPEGKRRPRRPKQGEEKKTKIKK